MNSPCCLRQVSGGYNYAVSEQERVENIQSTKLGLRLQPVPTARAYEVRIQVGSRDSEQAGIFTYSRVIAIANLTPGTVYTMQARAIGGTTG